MNELEAVYTVGKAPVVYGQASTEKRAWELWEAYRSAGLVPKRARVYRWPNGLKLPNGKYDLDGATRCDMPREIEVFLLTELPPVQRIITKGADPAIEALLANAAGPVDPTAPLEPSTIAGFFDLVNGHIANLTDERNDLKGALEVAEEELAELRGIKATLFESLRQARERIADLESGKAIRDLENQARSANQTADALSRKLAERQAAGSSELLRTIEDLSDRLAKLEKQEQFSFTGLLANVDDAMNRPEASNG